MFAWATSQLENIAQTVAPVPTDPESKFVLACQKNDETAALELLSQLGGDPVYKIVQKQKNQTALHIACLYSLPNLLNTILANQSPAQVFQVTDGGGNTCLHCACMSNAPNALDVVKLLVGMSKDTCGTKNYEGQTPYDVSVKSTVRQYLLPIQLQAETQKALDNGGVGLPPGIDLGGLKIKNSHLPPPPVGGVPGGPTIMSTPPTAGGMPAPAAAFPGTMGADQATGTPSSSVPNPGMFATPSPQQQQQQQQQVTAPSQTTSPSGDNRPPSNTRPPAAPSSTGSNYALRGRSSAAILKTTKGVQPDGFHSSSSDKSLQEKYGHVNVTNSNLPPPPTSGNSVGSGGGTMPLSAPPSLGTSGVNPYAGGLSALGSGGRRPGRYVAYDPITGARPHAPRMGATTPPGASAAGQYSMFTPPTPQSQPGQAAPFNPAASPAPFNPASVPAPFNPSSAPQQQLQPAPAGTFSTMTQPQKSRAATTGTMSFPRPPVMLTSTNGGANTGSTSSVPARSPTFQKTSSTGSASATFAKPANGGSPDAKTPTKKTDAAAMFAGPPSSTSPSTSERKDTAGATLGSSETSGESPVAQMTQAAMTSSPFARPPGIKQEGVSASQLFANPAAANGPIASSDGLGSQPSKSAAEHFALSASPTDAVSSPSTAVKKEPAQLNDNIDEDAMTDVPLTPGGNDGSTLTNLIGMPPPPFSKK